MGWAKEQQRRACVCQSVDRLSTATFPLVRRARVSFGSNSALCLGYVRLPNGTERWGKGEPSLVRGKGTLLAPVIAPTPNRTRQNSMILRNKHNILSLESSNDFNGNY